jgi:hypothetical protein
MSCKRGCALDWRHVVALVWALTCRRCGRVERYGDDLDAPRTFALDKAGRV